MTSRATRRPAHSYLAVSATAFAIVAWFATSSAAQTVLDPITTTPSATETSITMGGAPVSFVRWRPEEPTLTYDTLAPSRERRDALKAEGALYAEPAYTVRLHIRTDGTLEETVVRSRLFLTQSGTESDGEFRLSMVPSLDVMDIAEAYTLLPNGDRVDVDANDIAVEVNGNTPLRTETVDVVVPYPSLREEAISVLVTRTVHKTDHEPIPWARLYHPRGLAPRESVEFEITWEDDALQPAVETDLAGLSCSEPEERRIVCTADSIAAYPRDPNLSYADALPVLVVAEPTTWPELAAAVSELIDGAHDDGEAVKETVSEFAGAVLRARSAGAPGARLGANLVERLHEFLSQDIRHLPRPPGAGGIAPRPASVTLAQRGGDAKDKAALFVDMAREAGLRSHAVLTSTTRRDPDKLLVPALVWFDQMVACAAQPGVFEHCVDLSNPAAAMGTNPGALNGGIRLDLVEDATEPDTFTRTRYDRNVAVTSSRLMTNQGRFVDRERRQFAGNYASEMRADLREQDKATREANLLRAYQIHVDATMEPTFRVSGLDDVADAVVIESRASRAEAFDPATPISYAKPEPWLAHELTDLQSGNQYHDYDFDGFRLLGRSSVELPPGHRLVSTGATIDFQSDFGSMSRSYTTEDSQVRVETIVDLPAARIPKDQLADFNRFLNVILANAVIRFDTAATPPE